MSNVGFPSRYEPQSQQRNHRQSEVDELTRQSGENIKGYLPSTLVPPHLDLTSMTSMTSVPRQSPNQIPQPNIEDQANEVNRLQEQEVSIILGSHECPSR